MLLIVINAPSRPDALSLAAGETGLPVVEVRLRMTGVLPRVLMQDRDEGRLSEIGSRLTALGFVTAVVDPRKVPGDTDRIVARSLDLGNGELVAVQRAATDVRHVIDLEAIDLVQLGVRNKTETETSSTSVRKFALGRAVLTGGLVMTKQVEKTATTSRATRDPFVLVNCRDGGRDVILYEKRLDFRFLGSQMQPTSHGNLVAMLSRIRALVPAVPFDDRASRSSFVSSFPSVGADPVDLALHLVRIASSR